MSRLSVSRRAAAVAAVAATVLSGMTVAAPTAQAAPRLSWESASLKDKDDELIKMKHHPVHIGNVFWSDDPVLGSHLGDTLYIRDFASDGYSIRGQVKVASTNEIVIDIGTAGKKAPAKVQKTKNLKEGTKVKVRGCVMKAGKSYGCTSWYSARA
ncbi:hypothetical protein [Streptomyces poriticola]|uniref:hypothetical protein n=1 Tax=Streptomyces poriticola TaxID=3120506 RepID=UPI002FCE5934